MQVFRTLSFFAVAVGISSLPNLAWGVTFSEQGRTLLSDYNATTRSVSLGDIDNDGDLDVFFQGQALNATRLYRNDLITPTGTGPLSFSHITADWLVGPNVGDTWSSAWGDYNGDGRVDVFVGSTNHTPDFGDLLRNEGTTFSNQSTATGLNDQGFHQNVGWVDIDNDRDLDLFIGQEGPEKHQIYLQGYEGTPPGTFTPRGLEVGIQTVGTHAYGTAIGDTDGDGDFDIYISTCQPGGGLANNFYKNMLVETGQLQFQDITLASGTQRTVNTYGAEFHDFDNDLDLDLLVTGADGNITKMFRNDGNNVFTDVQTVIGHELLRNAMNTGNLRGSDFNGSKAVDYDNDGDLDLYFHDNQSSSPNHRLFENLGNWEFRDVTFRESLNVGADGVPAGVGGYDSAWGDLDRDGDQDLVVTNNTSSGATLYHERIFLSDASTNANHWLYVELEGPDYNTTGIGASLYAIMRNGTSELTLRREANTNIGTFNQSDLPVHFGLGAETMIDVLLVQWPDGTKQSYYNVAADQYFKVSYLPGDFNGDGAVDGADYVVYTKNLGTVYEVDDYDDYASNYGSSLGGGNGGADTNVPEPASMLMLPLAVAALLIRRRHGRS